MHILSGGAGLRVPVGGATKTSVGTDNSQGTGDAGSLGNVFVARALYVLSAILYRSRPRHSFCHRPLGGLRSG